eukprot:28157_2
MIQRPQISVGDRRPLFRVDRQTPSGYSLPSKLSLVLSAPKNPLIPEHPPHRLGTPLLKFGRCFPLSFRKSQMVRVRRQPAVCMCPHIHSGRIEKTESLEEQISDCYLHEEAKTGWWCSQTLPDCCRWTSQDFPDSSVPPKLRCVPYRRLPGIQSGRHPLSTRRETPHAALFSFRTHMNSGRETSKSNPSAWRVGCHTFGS